MGFTPEQIDRMSPWEYAACCDGFERAHGGKSRQAGRELDDSRLREMGIEGF